MESESLSEPTSAHAAFNPLITSSLQRQSITELARLFGARIVDVSHESVIVELSAKSTRVDAFLKLLRPFGILEAARSGRFTDRDGLIFVFWKLICTNAPVFYRYHGHAEKSG